MHYILCWVFWVKHQITQVTQPPYSADLAPCDFWLFPKSPLKGKRFQIVDEIHEAADGSWENCVRSQDDYFEGDWGIIVLCTMFLVSCIFFNKCLLVSILHGWVPSGQTIYIYICVCVRVCMLYVCMCIHMYIYMTFCVNKMVCWKVSCRKININLGRCYKFWDRREKHIVGTGKTLKCISALGLWAECCTGSCVSSFP